jgi:hypothetical protein
VTTGNQRHFVVPGVGLVLAQARRLVWDLTNEEIISSVWALSAQTIEREQPVLSGC